MFYQEQRHIVAYLDGLPPMGDLRQAKVNALPAPFSKRLRVACAEELCPFFGWTLMPSISDQAFKRHLHEAMMTKAIYKL